MPEHKDIQDPDIHEPKGTASAIEGQVFVADGLGSGLYKVLPPAAGTVSQGAYFYQDVATQTTPVALTTPGVEYDLPNDAAGAASINFPLEGLSEMWDETTSRFIFNEGDVLSIGDVVDFRLDIEVTTTTVNTAITVVIEGGIGGATSVITLIPEVNFKVAGTYDIVRWMGLFMRNSDVLTLPARVYAIADTAGATVTVHEWLLRPSHVNT